jgi:glycosyltransferase involved in cell wall biosynthesis
MSRVSLNYYHNSIPFYRVLERHILHRVVDCAIGNASVILKQLRAEGIPDSKLLLVHNGIDIAAFDKEMVTREQARLELNISPNSLVISSVANLFAYKGHQDLFKAMGHLRDCLPQDWSLLVVGRDVDDNLGKLSRLSGELGLTKHIRFLHQRLDVPMILSAADIHVSASHTEGFPNNVVEAMCARLPVVATDVGGVPELVVHQRTGLLVPAKAPGLMADAIHVLASDVGKRTAMGVAGRTRVELLCSIDNHVNALQTLYARFATQRDRASEQTK